MNKKLKWITVSYYVDIDTGEQISKTEANNNYVIIQKDKHVQKTEYSKWFEKVVGLYNHKGITTVTNQCRRKNRQLTIAYD